MPLVNIDGIQVFSSSPIFVPFGPAQNWTIRAEVELAPFKGAATPASLADWLKATPPKCSVSVDGLLVSPGSAAIVGYEFDLKRMGFVATAWNPRTAGRARFSNSTVSEVLGYLRHHGRRVADATNPEVAVLKAVVDFTEAMVKLETAMHSQGVSLHDLTPLTAQLDGSFRANCSTGAVERLRHEVIEVRTDFCHELVESSLIPGD